MKTFKTRAGLEMKTPAEDARAILLSMSALYGKKSLHTLLSILPDRNLSIDVGANCGQSALTYSQFFEKVVSFEPVPVLFDCLQYNLQANKINNVEAHNVAVGSKSGETIPFRYAKTGHFGSGVPSKVTSNCIEVPCETLDRVLVKQLPDFVKIDVEGYEFEVVSGAVSVLRRSKPIILIELVPEFMKKHGKTPQDVCELLFSLGYQMYDTKLNRMQNTWVPLKRERDRFFIHSITKLPKRGFGLQ